jgi:hypothetical protein
MHIAGLSLGMDIADWSGQAVALRPMLVPKLLKIRAWLPGAPKTCGFCVH